MTKTEKLEKRIRELESYGMKSFTIMTGIVDTMVDSKLDPKEFALFFDKYGEFIQYAMVNKKIQAQGSKEYDGISKDEAMTAGINCLASFVLDFQKDYEFKTINAKQS